MKKTMSKHINNKNNIKKLAVIALSSAALLAVAFSVKIPGSTSDLGQREMKQGQKEL